MKAGGSILALSGLLEEAAIGEVDRTLRKPFSVEELLSASAYRTIGAVLHSSKRCWKNRPPFEESSFQHWSKREVMDKQVKKTLARRRNLG